MLFWSMIGLTVIAVAFFVAAGRLTEALSSFAGGLTLVIAISMIAGMNYTPSTDKIIRETITPLVDLETSDKETYILLGESLSQETVSFIKETSPESLEEIFSKKSTIIEEPEARPAVKEITYRSTPEKLISPIGGKLYSMYEFTVPKGSVIKQPLLPVHNQE